MRKWRRFLPLLVVLAVFGAAVLMLRRYEPRYPTRAADGAAWDKEWTILGSVLGVEEPGDRLVLQDNNAALTYQDVYYATWTIGDPSPYVNDEGDEVELYPAQLYLLLYGCKDEENARAAVEEWAGLQRKTYSILSGETANYNDQDYTVYTYEIDSESNPYAGGVSAFAVYENYALSAELTCQSSFGGDVSAILADFLAGCHFNADLND